jgi:hypothetical protein
MKVETGDAYKAGVMGSPNEGLPYDPTKPSTPPPTASTIWDTLGKLKDKPIVLYPLIALAGLTTGASAYSLGKSMFGKPEEVIEDDEKDKKKTKKEEESV